MEGWGVMHTPVRRDLECSQAAHAKFSGCGLWTVAEFSWRRVFVQAKKRETKKQIGDRDCLLGQTQGADSVCVCLCACVLFHQILLTSTHSLIQNLATAKDHTHRTW